MGGHSTPYGKMGNALPTPSTRQQHRLSKPRTNTSSSNLLALVNQQEDRETSLTRTKTLDIEEIEAVVTSRSGERRSRQDARPRLRAHLFGSAIDPLRNEVVEDDPSRWCAIGELVSGVKDRLSRSRSRSPHSPNARGSSTCLANSLGASRLSLVPESSTPDLEESNRVLERIIARASTDELAAFNHISSPVDESAPNNILLSPIRRRSLLTPGIATRVPNDILRKPPQPENVYEKVDRDYYYNPRLSDSSPLARLAALGIGEGSQVAPVMRTATPTFSEYGHLGGLKLGTLRITNGAASPVPSDRTFHLSTCQSLPDSWKGGDYFTAPRPPGPDQGDVRSDLGNVHRQYVPSESMMDASTSNDKRRDVSGGIMKPAISVDTGLTSSVIPSSKHKKLHKKVHGDDVAGSGGSTISPSLRKQRHPSSLVIRDRSPKSALNMAEEYIVELPDSPYSQLKPTTPDSPQLFATSKANEFDDDLFEDEGIVLTAQEKSEMTGLHIGVEHAKDGHTQGGSREDALRILDGHAASTMDQGSRTTSSSKSSIVHAEINSSNFIKPGKPLCKADSGYSSNVSLRSLRKDQPPRNHIVTMPDDLVKIVHVRHRLSGPRAMPTPSTVDRPRVKTGTVVAPARKLSTRRPLTLGAPSDVKDPDYENASSFIISSESTTTLNSYLSCSTTASATHPKLRKPRPLSQPLPVQYITVQGYRELSQAHIPPVPSELAAKHAERFRNFPLLEHTYPSLQDTVSGDDVLSMPPIAVPVRFPSPANALEVAASSRDSPCQTTNGGTLRKVRSPHLHHHSVNLTKSERRSSSQSRSGDCDVLRTIADFGTVTESLGGSPYDVARSALTQEPRTSIDKTLIHPHQMSNTNCRGKNPVGMDDGAATRFALIRSKTRSQSFSRSRTPSNSSFNDRGGIPGKLIRPKSMIIDAPPVPALPSSEQVRLKEARITRSRSERPATLMVPQAMKTVLSESLDSNTHHRSETGAVDKSWESTRRSWLQRRKSAGESLLAHSQTFKNEVAIFGKNERKALKPKQTSNSANLAGTPSTESLLVPRQRPLPPQQAGATPNVNAANNSFERIAGRYDGGLNYGYEPGYGLGGSAGTRNTMTGASRKSVDVSRGYGIDLSDVPIFVART